MCMYIIYSVCIMLATHPSCHIMYVYTCVLVYICTFVQLNSQQSFIVVNLASLYMLQLFYTIPLIYIIMYAYTIICHYFTQLIAGFLSSVPKTSRNKNNIPIASLWHATGESHLRS